MGAEIGTRMTVVRLADGGLLVHSPIRWTEALGTRLEALGVVRHVLAPNLDHHLFVADFKSRYPEALFYATPGVREKQPTLRFDEVLDSRRTVASWNDTVEQAWFRSSSALQELVLFHRASRALISADLAFNIQTSAGWLSRTLLRLNDSYNTFGPSRVCRAKITDQRMARSDLDTILAFDPDQMVLAHGELLMTGATEALKRSYTWLT
jgi:hypothetical protein